MSVPARLRNALRGLGVDSAPAADSRVLGDPYLTCAPTHMRSSHATPPHPWHATLLATLGLGGAGGRRRGPSAGQRLIRAALAPAQRGRRRR